MANALTTYSQIFLVVEITIILATFCCLIYYLVLATLYSRKKQHLIVLLAEHRKEEASRAQTFIVKQMESFLVELQQQETLPTIREAALDNLTLIRKMNFYFMATIIVGNSAFVVGVIFMLVSAAFNIEMTTNTAS